MTRDLLDEMVKKWESKGIVFTEHASVSTAVFPGEPNITGLHGVLKKSGEGWSSLTQLGEASCIAHRMGFLLIGAMDLDGTKHSWGGECSKSVSVGPKEVVIGIVPETLFWELKSKSEALTEAVQKSFPYSQEDQRALGVEESLKQIGEESYEFWYWSNHPITITSNSETLHQMSDEIVRDADFEGNLRGLLNEDEQQEAATIICEGMAFLSKFSPGLD